MKKQMSLTLILLSLITLNVNAAPRLIIIAGYADSKRHENVSELATLVASANGSQVFIGEKDGKSWDFGNKAQIMPAVSKEDIENLFKEATKELKENENVTIFINDHGGPPESYDQPKTSRIDLYDDAILPLEIKGIDHNDLEEIIRKYVPAKNKVNLIGIQCFSGAVHNVAASLPNSCSASSTDYRTTTFSTAEMNLYGEGFWKESQEKSLDLNKDGKTSLYEAHLAAFFHDTKNSGRGQLSSMNYINSILKEDEYDNKKSGSFIENLMNFLTFNFVKSGPKKNSHYPVCNLSTETIRADEIKKLATEINKQYGISQGDIKRADLPTHQQTVLDFAQRDWNKNKANYEEKIKSLQSEYNSIKKEYDTLEKMERLKKRKFFRAKFAEFDEKAKKELAGFLSTYQIFKDLAKMQRFLKVATIEQKKKLQHLLNCEWEPL